MTEDRTLGYLQASVEDLKTGLEQLNGRIEAGFSEMNARFAETNARIDRLLYVVLAIGGGIIATLLGMVVTLIVKID